MKTASAGLIALLAAGGPFLMADLYTLTLQGGTIYRWAGSDYPITYGGWTFTPSVDQGGQPLITRGPIRNARGLEVDVLDVTLWAGDTAQILGIDANLAAHNGALDGARLKVERVLMATPGDTSNGTIVLFEGMVGDVDVSSTKVVAHVRSDLDRLTVQMPRTLFTPNCANAFGDASCGVNVAALTLTGTITSGSTQTSLNGAPSKAANYWQNGVVTFTSGANTGAMCAVSSYAAGGAVVLVTPLPAVPQAGDTFTISPGCARTIAACSAFGNSTRFRGCPFIPVPETTR